MEKMNEKTASTRMFKGLIGEQWTWSLCKVLLCLFLFLSGTTAVCAQSNENKVEIPLEKNNIFAIRILS